MDYILLIHSVLKRAFVGLAKDGILIDSLSNEDQKTHGAFLHEAIDRLLKKNALNPAALAAISVSTGPGSYTGIRVGLAAAKGIAFALQKPIVPVSTLEVLAMTAIDRIMEKSVYMPLFQARLSEYYAGWYNHHGKAIRSDQVIDIENVEKDTLGGKVYFFGPGINEYLIRNSDFEYLDVQDVDESSFARLAFEKYSNGQSLSASAASPSYLKAAYTTHSKSV